VPTVHIRIHGDDSLYCSYGCGFERDTNAPHDECHYHEQQELFA